MLHSPRFEPRTDAQGRWRGILSALGLDAKTLSGRHTECPICRNGTKSDSFRFDDKDGRGTWICSHCGAGDGPALVMKLRGVDFKGAMELIAPLAGHAQFEAPKAKTDTAPEARSEMTALWGRARTLDGFDVASRYFRSRGIKKAAYGPSLRVVDALLYASDGRTQSFPALLAKFVAPDGKAAILHRTWLAEPGKKAPVESPRKFFRGAIPPGGAVRLGPVAETMGVAEGIETALSAEALHQIPVWATCSAGELVKFVPPAECKHLIIFADNDASWTGQLSAYSLARRLTAVPPDKRIGVEVRLPLYHDRGEKDDWNDVLMRDAE